MRDCLGELNTELAASFGISLDARTGVNTGEIVTPGQAERQTLVLGDAFDLAARLGEQAAPGEILLGEMTWS